MKKILAQKNMWALALALLFPLLIGGFHAGTISYLGDTDRYYHFAISEKLASTSSLYLKTVPQAREVGWNNYFPDKEFFFHVITSVGHRLGGQKGVVFAALLCAIAAALVLYLITLEFLPPGLAFCSVFFSFFTYTFLMRMMAVRPHVLAVFLFLLINWGLLKRNRVLVGLACFFFVLSYHVLLVPIACLGLVAALALLEQEKEQKKWLSLAGAGAIGVVVGILVNPYFPSNLVLGYQHMMIPFLMQGALKGVSFGMELYQASSGAFLRFYWPALLILLVGFFALGTQESRRSERSGLFLRYLTALTVFFAGLSFQTLRGAEYLLPAAGMLFAASMAQWRFSEKSREMALGGLALVQAGFLLHSYQGEGKTIPEDHRILSVNAALSLIPPGEKGTLFNCDWDSGAQILSLRPGLRFVDLLDPTFLYYHDRVVFYAREDVRLGLVVDARGLVAHSFEADYALCTRGEAGLKMAYDPGFQQLYPRDEDLGGPFLPSVALFRVRKTEREEFVNDYLMERLPVLAVTAARKLPPPATTHKLKEQETKQGSYFSLHPETPISLESALGIMDPVKCAFLRPSAKEMKRLAGATLLGLGGGQSFRVWRNGAPLFTSGKPSDVAQIVKVVVPLSSPVQPSDRFDILVCSAVEHAQWGVAVSLWTEKNLSELCAWKNQFVAAKGVAIPPPGTGWMSMDKMTCIGEMSVTAIPSTIRPARY